jgi:hypothetical protein
MSPTTRKHFCPPLGAFVRMRLAFSLLRDHPASIIIDQSSIPLLGLQSSYMPRPMFRFSVPSEQYVPLLARPSCFYPYR